MVLEGFMQFKIVLSIIVMLIISVISFSSFADLTDTSHKASLSNVDKTLVTVPDSTIIVEIKEKIAETPALNGQTINISSDKGIVTLEGIVSTHLHADTAVSVAKAAKGVKHVKNNLSVQK